MTLIYTPHFIMIIYHMPITELENDSESIWVKVFANKTSHFVASWYRPPGSTSEEFKLFREQLDYIKTHHKGKKLPSAHVLGDFNFKDIDWPDRPINLHGLANTSIFHNNLQVMLSPLKSPVLRKYSNPFKRPGMYPSISKCNAKRCNCCMHLCTNSTVTSSVNGRKFSVVNNSDLD